MNITIVGGGNVGTQFAVHCAKTGHKVTIYTFNPKKIKKKLIIVNEYEEKIHEGEIFLATSDENKAFSNVDLIFVTYPSFEMEEIANKIFLMSEKI